MVLLFMFPLAWWLLASFKPYTAIFNTTPVYVGFEPTTTNYEVTLLGRSRVEADSGVGGTAGGGSSFIRSHRSWTASPWRWEPLP